MNMFLSLLACNILCTLIITSYLLLISGDIHPNPDHNSDVWSSSFCCNDLYNFLNLPNHLSTIHYNVQSIFNKVDTLMSEFSCFDVLSFTETWLNDLHSSDEILFPSFQFPERKDRIGDRHGGVILYVKNNVAYKRRYDLERNRLENIWVEIKFFSSRNVLYGVFYRPPNADSVYNSLIEDSISLAVDTGIPDIIIMGDFNWNSLQNQSNRKTESVCNQFNLVQCIEEPTHFTENSSSIIDLLFVANKDSILTSGVGEPCLDLSIRYHCPIFGVFNFLKAKCKSIKRKIWQYQNGNYDQLRQNLSEIDWDSNYSDDPDEYAHRITNIITENVSSTIPNKKITINPQDPAWMTLKIKPKIRQRKRYYRKAKRTNSPQHWLKFKKLRNEIISCIRNTKKKYFDRMILRLRSGNLSPKDWWKALKSFVSPNKSSSKSISPLVDPITDQFVVDEDEKANVFNSFFASQSTIDDSSHGLPSECPKFEGIFLNNMHITYTDVLDVLRTLSIGKASGPDGIDNRILVEAASQLVNPLCRLFNLCLDKSTLPSSWKSVMFVQF